MPDTDLKLRKLIATTIFTILTTLTTLITYLKTITRYPIIRLCNLTLHYYFLYHNLTSLTFDLKSTPTTIHFYIPTHRRRSKPNLILLHGFGGDARWQFYPLLKSLSPHFNLYIPDLLFFGQSFTHSNDRSIEYQARCVMEGLCNELGVEKCSVFAMSYGGWVAYKMAAMNCPEVIEKVVIVSSGVGYSEEQRNEHLGSLGFKIEELLLPQRACDLRKLVEMVSFKYRVMRLNWVPDFFLQQFINVMDENYKEQRRELVDHMMKQKADSENLPVLKQKTLLIWGDKDKVFPLYLGYQLQRHLSPNARLEIIKDCGHAPNMDAPSQLTHLINSFLLDTTSLTT